jgi:hypothetical protein
MSELLDELARTLARPVPRRRAVRMLAGVVVGAAVTAVRVPQAPARTERMTCDPGFILCKDVCPSVNGLFYGQLCCPPGTKCGCAPPPNGATLCVDNCQNECGSKCCATGEFCASENSSLCCQEGQSLVYVGDEPKCKNECKHEKGRATSPYYNPETECCTESGVQQKYPMQNVGACDKTSVPRKDYQSKPNGCGPAGHKFPSKFGKASFLAACNAHDSCYDRCKSSATACNDQFCDALMEACSSAYPAAGKNRSSCEAKADLYCTGVRLLGSGYWEDAQKKACQCCP